MKLADLLRPFRPAAAPAAPTLLRSAARTHTGRVRQVNEDRLLDRTDAGLWAIADGMGGHAGGDLAAADVIRALDEVAGESAAGQMADRARIIAALDAANAAIHARAGDGASGSTVAALQLAGSRFLIFWAGDSRVYRLRGEALERLSHDHSLVQALVDAGALPAESAARHPQANVITRALGTAATIEIEVAGGLAEPGDVFLLCSDGLSGCVPDAAIADRLGLPIEIAADALLAEALAAGGADNISLVIVAVPPSV